MSLNAPDGQTANDEHYRVQLPVFEGPLDLLLHLIEREELDITSVALAQVTDQYLAYLHAMAEGIPIDAVADFMVMAARLVQIKSQALLPRPRPPEQSEEDSAEELARLLREYKKFKQAAQVLKAREARGLHMHIRLAPPPPLPAKLDMSGVTLDKLMDAVRDALIALPPRMPSHLVPGPRISIRDRMAQIMDELASAGQATFRAVLGELQTKAGVIVTLLAVLELSRRRRIRLEQPNPFGDILILPETAGPPTDIPDSDLMDE